MRWRWRFVIIISESTRRSFLDAVVRRRPVGAPSAVSRSGTGTPRNLKMTAGKDDGWHSKQTNDKVGDGMEFHGLSMTRAAVRESSHRRGKNT